MSKGISKIKSRNDQVVALMESLFDEAEGGRYTLDADTASQVELLFSTNSWGFREIFLLVVVARLLDTNYSASTALYGCNPRALYEGPIRETLRKRHIPHRKSGPLNVAKAIKGLNDQWASQKSPRAVAEQVVRLVKMVEQVTPEELRNIAIGLHARFLQEASRVASLTVEGIQEIEPEFLYQLSSYLINNVPDAGNTPQRIVGLLLYTFHSEAKTGLKVSGYKDRASVTSTTSKKLGDITEEQLDGTPICNYEITVKQFDDNRVIDSYESVRAYDKSNGIRTEEVLVICRAEDKNPNAIDMVSTTIYLGKFEYQDLTYHFLDIYGWIMAQLMRMPSSARLKFYEMIQEYVSDHNTSEKVKTCWAAFHSSQLK